MGEQMLVLDSGWGPGSREGGGAFLNLILCFANPQPTCPQDQMILATSAAGKCDLLVPGHLAHRGLRRGGAFCPAGLASHQAVWGMGGELKERSCIVPCCHKKVWSPVLKWPVEG